MKVRRVIPVVVTLVIVGVLFVGVFPTRTWMAQRSSIAGAEEQLRVLEEQNGLLEKRIAALQEDEEIERLAREQYNLVRPGEEAYALLPPAGSSDAAPDAAVEAAAEEDDDRSVVESVVDFLTFWG
jgi:cell division protein FtsB